LEGKEKDQQTSGKSRREIAKPCLRTARRRRQPEPTGSTVRAAACRDREDWDRNGWSRGTVFHQPETIKGKGNATHGNRIGDGAGAYQYNGICDGRWWCWCRRRMELHQ
jgi:hypothetical protein